MKYNVAAQLMKDESQDDACVRLIKRRRKKKKFS